MKYILSILLFSVAFLSCETDGSGTGEPDKVTPPPATTCVPTDPAQKIVFDALAKDFWVVTGYYKAKEKGAARKNRGRWYDFNNDCTYTVGHYDKVISKGTWKLENDPPHIRLDALEVSEDGLWRVQMNSEGSMTVFIGTEEYQTNMIQQRLENIMFAPKNAKEMGWEQ